MNETTDNELSDIIREAAETAARQAVAEYRRSVMPRNHFKITEQRLWNYRSLEKLVTSLGYVDDAFVQHRSKSIVQAPSGSVSTAMITDDEILADIRAQRSRDYARYFTAYELLTAAIDIFRADPDWPVVGMYYLGEDRNGNLRPEESEPMSWETIALELGINEKTARRRRSRIIRSLSIVLGLTEAAESAVITWERSRPSEPVPESGLDSARNKE